MTLEKLSRRGKNYTHAGPRGEKKGKKRRPQPFAVRTIKKDMGWKGKKKKGPPPSEIRKKRKGAPCQTFKIKKREEEASCATSTSMRRKKRQAKLRKKKDSTDPKLQKEEKHCLVSHRQGERRVPVPPGAEGEVSMAKGKRRKKRGGNPCRP